jgi:hypothetical protein
MGVFLRSTILYAGGRHGNARQRTGAPARALQHPFCGGAITWHCRGLAAGGVLGLYRSERFWGLTMVGLLLNVPLPLVLLCSGLNFLSTWLKHG